MQIKNKFVYLHLSSTISIFAKNIKENLKKMENIQKKINQYSIDGEFIKTWDSVKEAGHSLGIRRAFISSVLTGVKKSAKGFKFTYYEQ